MNQSWMWRWSTALMVLTALLLGVSGCSGGAARPMSWTGLTVVGERLYVADIEQARALDVADGESLWAFPKNPEEDNNGVFYVAPAVDEEHIITASQIPGGGFFSQPRNIVWALDREAGYELWRFDGAAGQYVEGGALSGDLFVIGNSDGNVYALDVESGALRWVFETGHRVWATPLIVSDVVYIGSMDRHLYALRLSDGQVVWDFHAEGAFASMPALLDDTLYAGTFDDRLYAIDAHTGTERWRFAGENWFWGGPVVYGDTIYAADVNGNVYAVEAETGEQVWHRPLNVPVRAGPTLTEDGSRLFVGSENGTLYALDTSDGFVIWSRENEGQMLSTPVVHRAMVYGMLIQGSHRILALHVDNGREMWVYPRVVEEQE